MALAVVRKRSVELGALIRKGLSALAELVRCCSTLGVHRLIWRKNYNQLALAHLAENESVFLKGLHLTSLALFE